MMRTKKVIKQIFLLVTICLFTMQCEAQNVRDFESWNALGLEYKINKKVQLELQGQLRLDEKASEINQYFSQFTLDYSFVKGFHLSGGIRYIRRNDNEGKIQGYENHLRLQTDLVMKRAIFKRTKLSSRLRYQTRSEIGVSGPVESRDFLRLKTGLAYNIKNWKLDPKLFAEIFYQLNSRNQFNKYRIGFGTSYKLNKSNKLALTYLYETEINTLLPEASNIIRLAYTFEI